MRIFYWTRMELFHVNSDNRMANTLSLCQTQLRNNWLTDELTSTMIGSLHSPQVIVTLVGLTRWWSCWVWKQDTSNGDDNDDDVRSIDCLVQQSSLGPQTQRRNSWHYSRNARLVRRWTEVAQFQQFHLNTSCKTNRKLYAYVYSTWTNKTSVVIKVFGLF